MTRKKTLGILITAVLIFTLFACGQVETDTQPNNNTVTVTEIPVITNPPSEAITKTPSDVAPTITPTKELDISGNNTDKIFEYAGKEYEIIEVDGGDKSGDRQPNVAVDIGFGDRIYWALTNEYGQLVYVIADKIILQDDTTEPVNSSGRYYNDEAKVPGTEHPNLDEGHVIADSLGGVSNAYNITPQDSTLNRHGNQAYMEKVIRDAGGCEQFLAIITYPDTKTQIPSKYRYEYILKGNKIIDEFENVNPDDANAYLTQAPIKEDSTNAVNEKSEIAKVDTNKNGKVTIAEAKAAGYKMPIYSDHWLYKYMDDRDGDGMVGE